MRSPVRRHFIHCLALAALAFGGLFTVPASAQSGGDTITLVVPFPAGGSADAFGRLLAEEMGKALNTRVMVDNRAGGSGIIGMDYTAKSTPDGRTLLLATNSAFVNNIAMFDKMPLNIEKDLTPVAMVGAQSMLMVARKGAPFHSLAELVSYARTHPGAVSRGSTGQGSITHLGFVRFEMQQGIQTNHVPYKGDAPALNDLLGETVDLYIGGGNAIRQSIASGKLQGIAVMGPRRFADLPNVKTMRELGYPDADAIAWFGVVAPSATPAATLERLSKALNRITSTPAMNTRMVELGIDTFTMDRPSTVKYFEADRERWVPLIRRLGIKAN